MNTTRIQVAHFGMPSVKTPPRLNLNEILVFGSTLSGEYCTSFERIAHREYGAPYDIPEGMAGCCYALPVRIEPRHYRPLADIEHAIDRMFECARKNNLWHFLVPVLMHNAGYTNEALARVFFDRPIPANVYLPHEYAQFALEKTLAMTIDGNPPCPVCHHPISVHGLSSVTRSGGPYHRTCTGALIKPTLLPSQIPA